MEMIKGKRDNSRSRERQQKLRRDRTHKNPTAPSAICHSNGSSKWAEGGVLQPRQLVCVKRTGEANKSTMNVSFRVFIERFIIASFVRRASKQWQSIFQLCNHRRQLIVILTWMLVETLKRCHLRMMKHLLEYFARCLVAHFADTNQALCICRRSQVWTDALSGDQASWGQQLLSEPWKGIGRAFFCLSHSKFHCGGLLQSNPTVFTTGEMLSGYSILKRFRLEPDRLHTG